MDAVTHDPDIDQVWEGCHERINASIEAQLVQDPYAPVLGLNMAMK